MKAPSMTAQSDADKIQHLKEQLDFLRSSSEAYDAGNRAEAKRLSTHIVTLVLDRGRNISLLTQLQRNNILFFDTGALRDAVTAMIRKDMAELQATKYKGRVFGKMMLQSPRLLDVAIMGANPQIYTPLLDRDIQHANRIPLNEWWEQVVVTDGAGNEFTRRSITTNLRDTDGGSHIDPNLKTSYFAMARSRSANMRLYQNDELIQEHNPIAPTVRQIAFEVDLTLRTELADLLN